jgi:hypothetical protein
VQVLVGAGAPCNTPAALQAAAERGELELMEWLCDAQGAALGAAVLEAAAKGGAIAAVELLVTRGCPMSDMGMAYVKAGMRGDRAMLEALRRLGVPWSGHTLSLVAGVVELPVVQWMVEAGVPTSAHGLREAREMADGVNHRVAKWLKTLR